MRAVWGTLVAVVCAAGCYDPSIDRCNVACAVGDRCPGALTCMTDGFCHAAGDTADCMPDATPMPDAAAPGAYTMITGGNRHTCAITGDGALHCWGSNTRSQVGDPDVGRRTGTPTVLDGTGWTRIDGGASSTCGLRDQQLWCWGSNEGGEAGQSPSDTTEVVVPTQVDPTGPDDFVELSVGDRHACAIRGTAEARLYCWGIDSSDQLGTGPGDDSGFTLQEIDGGFTDWLMVSAGGSHTCGLRSNGEVRCWGRGTAGELGTGDAASHASPTPVVSGESFRFVAAGRGFSCAITQADGQLFCWGDNSSHQLGLNGIAASPTPARVGTATGWTQVGAEFNGACGIQGGAMRCWGGGLEGEIGNGSFGDSPVPDEVTGLQGVTAMGAGDFHACAIVDGAVSCWGLDSDGQLGTGTVATKYVPTQIGADEDWDEVAAATRHTCGIRGGALYCWGSNESIALGVAAPADPTTPQRIGADVGWRAVGVGTESGCALRDASPDELWCWGSDSNGQLGNGTTAGDRPATKLTNPAGVTTWDVLAVGPHQACATSGTARYCWGEGAEGGLGNGNTSPLNEPTLVASETLAWSRISLGDRFGAGLVGNHIYTWGRGDDGQLGGGSTVMQLSPVMIIDNNWSDVTTAFNANHACAIGNGAISCWGANSSGKLGNGNTDPQAVPTATVDVPNPNAYATVRAGGEHTCASHAAGLFCWGNEESGQLGDEELVPYVDQPTAITSLAFASLSAGSAHTCGITGTGALYCWGANVRGQLGDGTSAHAVPVPIIAAE